jgi:hypothetical protein
MLVPLMAMKRPACGRSSYAKFGEQFPSARVRVGQAHVLNTVFIFVKAA